MTLNKIGSDFKKLNFYWLFEKVKLHFFFTRHTVFPREWHVLHLLHAIFYIPLSPIRHPIPFRP